jgi:exopolysaccharide production protein ExoY
VKYYGSSAEEVTQVLPGMTGLWQVMGRNRLSYRRRRRLDVFLVRHFSTRLYFMILLRTIPSVLFGRNAW